MWPSLSLPASINFIVVCAPVSTGGEPSSPAVNGPDAFTEGVAWLAACLRPVLPSTLNTQSPFRMNPGQTATATTSVAAPFSSSASVAPDRGPVMDGSEILVACLEREGVDTIFAYPGGASMPIHQALTKSTKIRTVLPRHEQGGVFAAEGYARASGRAGVCMATSGPRRHEPFERHCRCLHGLGAARRYHGTGAAMDDRAWRVPGDGHLWDDAAHR